ncbi:MAG TPA: 2-hydroxyacid dehydrogenase [Pseudonocardiaceae bacterium]|nr:2-hydroxyacid dehydrogenase [Pseudonocardiaceae bacterium]
MRVRALVPFADVPVPSGVLLDHYDGVGAPPADVSDVEFYVLPYDRGDQPAELIAKMPALRAVQALTAGVDRLLPVVPPQVPLYNGSGLHDASTAEHALALMLAAQRELPRWLDRQAHQRWDHELTGSVAGSRVTILGHGAIGRALQRRLVAAEAEITKVAAHARPAEDVHAVTELPSLLPSTDILVMILPDSPATVGLVGARELALLPDGALVVNVGRGRTLDTEALLAELTARRLRAALDVTDPEPLPADHPLWTMPGVLITPHVAGGSSTFWPRARTFVAEQLRRFVADEPLLNPVPR